MGGWVYDDDKVNKNGRKTWVGWRWGSTQTVDDAVQSEKKVQSSKEKRENKTPPMTKGNKNNKVEGDMWMSS